MWDYILLTVVGIAALYVLVRLVVWKLFKKENYKG